jgi:hypothetical protein
MTGLNRLRADALRAGLALLDAELAALPAPTAAMIRGAVLDGGRATIELGRDASGAVELCVCAVTAGGKRKVAQACPEAGMLLKSRLEHEEILSVLRNAVLVDPPQPNVPTSPGLAERDAADAIENRSKQSLPGDF